MAITKRVKVSFDMKIVCTTEDAQAFTEHMLELSKQFMDGEKLTGEDLELARAAAEGGIESALELSIKMAVAKRLKDELAEPQVSVANIRQVFTR